MYKVLIDSWFSNEWVFQEVSLSKMLCLLAGQQISGTTLCEQRSVASWEACQACTPKREYSISRTEAGSRPSRAIKDGPDKMPGPLGAANAVSGNHES